METYGVISLEDVKKERPESKSSAGKVLRVEKEGEKIKDFIESRN